MEPSPQKVKNNNDSLNEEQGNKQEPPLRTISVTAPPFVPSSSTPMNSTTSFGKSKALSPDAPAFYPKNYLNYVAQSVIQEETGKWKHCEEVLDELRAAIHMLIIDPGHFEQLMPSLARKLASLMPFGGCSSLPLIEEIFTQSIEEVNFRYTGARMCNYLSHSFEPAFHNFQQDFLSRCEKEHQSIMLQSQPPLSHVIGYSLFIGELLLNVKEITSSRVIPQFPAQISQLLTYLLNNRSKEALLCSVQLLKLTGAVLEENLPNLDEIFEKLNVIIKEDLPQNVASLIQSVMNQRLNSWGQRNNEPLMSAGAGDSIDSPLDESPINNLSENEIFNNHSFSSDEREMANLIEECEDQCLSDQYWIGDQKMDDETATAFEQFMAESQAARTTITRSRTDASASGMSNKE